MCVEKKILDGASRAGKQIFVGGNFNTHVHVGIRGEGLTNFCTNFDIQIAKDGDDEDVVAKWCFRSSMGVARKLISFCVP